MAVTIWEKNRLKVTAALDQHGDLVLAGHALHEFHGFDEYEYWITVTAVDIPRLVEGLGGVPGADVLQLVAASADLIMRDADERQFFDSLGIETTFFSYF